MQRAAITTLISSLIPGLANADMVESPMRMRFNSDLVKKIFHKGDHQVLANFHEMAVGQVPPIPMIWETDEDGEKV